MLIENVNGFLVISEIIDKQLVSMRYLGYSKNEAISLFNGEFGIGNNMEVLK